MNRLLTSHPSDWYGGPHSIRVTDYEGTLNGLTDIGTFGTSPGQFNDPAGVAVDAQSRIYVSDRGNNRVQVLSSAGASLAYLGGFSSPEGIAVGSDYRVFVCDTGNQRVQVLQFAPNDNSLAFVDLLSGAALPAPVGVAVAANGHVFVSDHELNTVEEFNYDGKWVRTHAQALSPYSGPLQNPGGVAIDTVGRVIVCDTGNRRVVLVYSPELLGDLNCDNNVTTSDIAPFVLALVAPSTYESTFDCNLLRGDMNGDLAVNGADVQGFVALLIGQ